jgi:hypothetical protein
MALIKPWQFVKAIEELKSRSDGGNIYKNSGGGAGAENPFHAVFNVQRKHQQAQM